MCKGFEQFTEEESWMASKHLKRSSISLIISEINIETVIHFITLVKMKYNTKSWWRHEEIVFLKTWWATEQLIISNKVENAYE